MGTHQLRVHVVPPSDRGFEAEAARIAEDLIRESKRGIGITWGRTLATVFSALPSAGRFAADKKQAVIPLCGEPLYLQPETNEDQFFSTALACQLQQRLYNRVDAESPSLRGVPAYIASDFEPRQRAAIMEFINRIPGFQRIFGSCSPNSTSRGARQPLVDEVGVLFTGIGVLNPSPTDRTGIFINERLAQEKKFDRKKLDKLIDGDIGGILLPRASLKKSQCDQVELLNGGWIGMSAELYRRCVKRADRNKEPGVVVIAAGSQKKKAVLSAIRLGLVSTLIISQELADAMK